MQACAKRRFYIALAVLGAGVLGAVLLCQRHSGISSYQGKAIKTWARQTLASEPKVRDEATAAFKAMGSRAVPALVRLLQTRDSHFRTAAWFLIPKVPRPFQRLVSGRIHRPDAALTRRAAAHSLGWLGPEANGAVPALAEVMRTDKVVDVSWEAASALSRIGGTAVVAELGAALADKKPHVRYAAASALVNVGPEASPITPALLNALEDESEYVRAPAAACLSKLMPTVLPLLTNALQSSDGPTRQRAARAVAWVRPPRNFVLPLLLEMLHDPDPAFRLQAVRTLMALGLPNPTMVNAYLGALQDANEKVRLAAVGALSAARLQAAGAVTGLTGCLEDASPAVRESAARILGTFGARAQPAAAKLRRTVEADKQPSVQAAAKEALARIEAAK